MNLPALASALCIVSTALAAPFTIDWHSVDGGGVISSNGGSFSLSGTIGQHDAAATIFDSGYALAPGFWAVQSPTCDADFNRDGAIDLFDYLDFVDAFASASALGDFNHDGSIDLFDYLDFVRAFAIGC